MKLNVRKKNATNHVVIKKRNALTLLVTKNPQKAVKTILVRKNNLSIEGTGIIPLPSIYETTEDCGKSFFISFNNTFK